MHLTNRVPIARNPDVDDWYRTMDQHLSELTNLQKECGGAPVVIAGDIFDRWNVPPQLLSLAIDSFREMGTVYAIPGNHDIPYHNKEELYRSAYNTLVAANAITNVPDRTYFVQKETRVKLRCFPFGSRLAENKLDTPNDCTVVAVVHDYIWKDEHSAYPGVDGSKKASVIQKLLKNKYIDVGVFGDNHVPFELPGNSKLPTVFNCGCFIRRTSKEREYFPSVGLLLKDKTMVRYMLKTPNRDTFTDEPDRGLSKEKADNAKVLLNALEALHDQSLNFHAAINRYVETHNVDMPIRKIILKAIEDAE